MARARRGFRRALSLHQPACKPGSVWRDHSRVAAIPLGRRLRGASSSQPGRLVRRPDWARLASRARVVPIRLCSRWGLPCRFRCRKRGALLPHLFTLTPARSRGGTFSVALSLRPLPAFAGKFPAGRYPAPCLRGARTFLCACAQRPPGRLTLEMRRRARRVKGACVNAGLSSSAAAADRADRLHRDAVDLVVLVDRDVIDVTEDVLTRTVPPDAATSVLPPNGL